jgi:hypothetical protein
MAKSSRPGLSGIRMSPSGLQTVPGDETTLGRESDVGGDRETRESGREARACEGMPSRGTSITGRAPGA